MLDIGSYIEVAADKIEAFEEQNTFKIEYEPERHILVKFSSVFNFENWENIF